MMHVRTNSIIVRYDDKEYEKILTVTLVFLWKYSLSLFPTLSKKDRFSPCRSSVICDLEVLNCHFFSQYWKNLCHDNSERMVIHTFNDAAECYQIQREGNERGEKRKVRSNLFWRRFLEEVSLQNDNDRVAYGCIWCVKCMRYEL